MFKSTVNVTGNIHNQFYGLLCELLFFNSLTDSLLNTKG